MIAVAVAVAAVVGPAVIGHAAIAGTATGATGLTAAIGATGAAIVGGAIAGVASSLASQLVGLATGNIDRFSWKAVALAGIGGAVAGGLSTVSSLNGATGAMGALQDAGRAALGSAITQGIGVATGLQDKFDWAGVAVTGVMAGVGRLASDNISGHADYVDGKMVNPASHANQFAANAASSLAGAAARSLLTGTDFGDNILASLPDLIGSTIGQIAADSITGRHRVTGEDREALLRRARGQAPIARESQVEPNAEIIPDITRGNTDAPSENGQIYDDEIVVVGQPATLASLSLPISLPRDPLIRSTAKSYIRLNTGMPPFPPVRPSDGGSGDYNSESPTEKDKRFRNQMRIKAEGGWLLGYTEASRNLTHFLEGSGTTLDVDVLKMLNGIDLFRDEFQKQYRATVIDEVNLFITSEYHGDKLQFAFVPKKWSSSEAAGIPGLDEDWFLAMGKFDFNFTSTVNVTPLNNGLVRVDINSNLHVYDRYDWNTGQRAKMPDGKFVYDNDMARLHRTGLGQDFEIRGSTPVKPVTYIYDPRRAQPRTKH